MYMLRIAPEALIALAIVITFVDSSIQAACPSGSKCACVEMVTNTCIGGVPGPCETCAGLFMPCWDNYCYFADSRCTSDPGGGACVETLVSTVKGLQRQCIRGAIDWFTCWGQPICVTVSTVNIPGNTYSCSVTTGS